MRSCATRSRGATLVKTDLSGADLTGANLVVADVRFATSRARSWPREPDGAKIAGLIGTGSPLGASKLRGSISARGRRFAARRERRHSDRC
jgi:uncharacterized protein YjbI with pentapeptide repeats